MSSNHFDEAYHSLCQEVLDYGQMTDNRTGVPALSVFAPNAMRFNLQKGFPLITTKRIHFQSVVGELMWMLSGSTNADVLREQFNTSIWDEWADDKGELGPVYGKQWRAWPAKEASHITSQSTGLTYQVTAEQTVDQIATIVDQLRNDPTNRGIILSAWNVAQLEQMALRPCHAFAQWSVRSGGVLDCHLYQRSADVFLGVPFNIAQYALLTTIFAHITELTPGIFTHSLGDAHIYSNHLDQVKLQLGRGSYPPCYVSINPMKKNIDELLPTDIYLSNYVSHPGIKGAVAI